MNIASTGAAQIVVEHKCAEGLTLMGEALRLRVLWRCPTLPQPVGCSTIGAAGLSFQVRNGAGRFPGAMTTTSISVQHAPHHVVWWGCGLIVVRIVVAA